MVQIGPPRPQVLVAKDPRLAVGPIRDRYSPLAYRPFNAVVKPVEAFATGDVGLKVFKIVDRTIAAVCMLFPIPPVGQRHVVVDPDEIDIRRRPQRIEVEVDVPVGTVAEIL